MSDFHRSKTGFFHIIIYIIYTHIYTKTNPSNTSNIAAELHKESDMTQWLERGALPMSLPAVRFRIPLSAEFSETYHVSPLSILRHC